MKWLKFRLKTTTSAEDMVSSMLADLGIQGVEIEDHLPLTDQEKKEMFVDIPPETGADDGVAYVTFYLEEGDDKETILNQVEREMADMASFLDVGEGTIEESITEDEDWVNNWKQYFHQFWVNDILIVPSWEQPEGEASAKTVLRIDPGTAFGTGEHETTQLCIRQIEKYVTPDDRLLDVGCGSGILSIVALKLGASYAVGTDLDSSAITVTKENMAANGISEESYQVLKGNLIDDPLIQHEVGEECYDIVAANILAEVLVDLTPEVVRLLKKGGIYITSGILTEKVGLVENAIEKAGLQIIEKTCQGEWTQITARK